METAQELLNIQLKILYTNGIRELWTVGQMNLETVRLLGQIRYIQLLCGYFVRTFNKIV